MIEIKNIQYFDARIPFNRTFKHASAERNTTETVIVRITDREGNTGYGEGCPRTYVTGESLSTVSGFISDQETSYLQVNSLERLVDYTESHRRVIDGNPAAWCAIETALLDLLARQQGVNVETLLGRNSPVDNYPYTAVIGDGPPEPFHQLFLKYYQLGFRDYKIKLCNDMDRDRAKIDIMRSYGNDIAVRADANNLWQDVNHAVNHILYLSFGFSGIEEPLQSRNIDDLSHIAEDTGTKIVLDESVLKKNQLHDLSANPHHWVVNARVSKYGGILRSLELVEELVSLDVQVVVGAHVGETSLLTRAALIVADAAGDKLRAQEGGFSTHLLTMDPFEPNLKIGRKGILDKALLECRKEPGFGLDISDAIKSSPELLTPL